MKPFLGGRMPRAMSTTTTLRERKAALRKRIRDELRKIDSKEIERQSGIITKHVLQLPSYQDARSIAIFLSMPGREVSTRDIVLQAFEDGKAVFIPYLRGEGGAVKSKVMDMLQLNGKEDFHTLTPDGWGIPSLSKDSVDGRRNALGGTGISNRPNGKEVVPNLDLIFMPAVAFDQSHRRLGHGKGFYDRYLQTYKNALDSCQPGHRMPHLGKLLGALPIWSAG